MEKEIRIIKIPLDRVLPHPENPNRMGKANFEKLKLHIKQTGNYEPLIVRKHPEITDSFQIINGHHRAKALEELGESFANCVLWEANDDEARILLATLNRLGGKDELSLKIELIKKLSQKFSDKELGKLLPDPKEVIEKLKNITNLKFEISNEVQPKFLNTLVFFLNDEQMQIVRAAIEKAMPEKGIRRRQGYGGQAKAEKTARAITTIAKEWMNN